LYFLKVFEYPAYFFKSIENNTVGSQWIYIQCT
jgi:hypothetical protein